MVHFPAILDSSSRPSNHPRSSHIRDAPQSAGNAGIGNFKGWLQLAGFFGGGPKLQDPHSDLRVSPHAQGVGIHMMHTMYPGTRVEFSRGPGPGPRKCGHPPYVLQLQSQCSHAHLKDDVVSNLIEACQTKNTYGNCKAFRTNPGTRIERILRFEM